MATITTKTNAKPSTLPKPPKAKKPPKAWVQKQLENIQRTLKAATRMHERWFKGASSEARPEWRDQVERVGHHIDVVRKTLSEVLPLAHRLDVGAYVPQSEVRGIRLENGAQVWLRAKVWTNKYVGLYKPEELDGLTIVSINGKKALAKSTSGITVVEPTGSFTRSPVSYEAPSA